MKDKEKLYIDRYTKRTNATHVPSCLEDMCMFLRLIWVKIRKKVKKTK